MGHSDAFPLPETATAEEPTGPASGGVQVWGDMSQAPAVTAPEASGTPAPEGADPEVLFNRIGHLTRTLHDALSALGYQESLADARDNLPDARDRLEYIARLTGDAAEKVLNSVDRARSVQDEMSEHAKNLRTRWAAVAVYAAGGDRATPAGAALMDETCAFLSSLDSKAEMTNGILTDIMMAQDFHDLTGQVIRKVVSLAQTLEEQLVGLLIDATPVEQRKKVEPGVLEGPVVNAETRVDIVTDQAGVDDLLASLGF
jgi:chemotaxis protein CheZ